MWKTIQDLLIPDILVLSGDDTSVLSHLGEFLMEMEMRIHRFDVAEEEDPDPFKIRSSRTRSTAQHRDMLLGFVKEPKWKTGIDDAAKQLVSLTKGGI